MDWTGIAITRQRYKKGASIFAQGAACDAVLYVEQGSVRLSVVSHQGKEVVVALLEPGEFFGEGCLSGQPLRIASATAQTASVLIAVEAEEFSAQLLRHTPLADVFLRHMLTRNARIEEDLIDQLFNDVEKRLARMLLVLARFGEEREPHRVLPKLTQSILAEMIGTTRSRVSTFMNKFRKLGFIRYNGAIEVHRSLLTVVLRESHPTKSGAQSMRAPKTPPRSGA